MLFQHADVLLCQELTDAQRIAGKRIVIVKQPRVVLPHLGHWTTQTIVWRTLKGKTGAVTTSTINLRDNILQTHLSRRRTVVRLFQQTLTENIQ